MKKMIANNIEKIVLIFLLLTPILDIITSLSIQVHHSSFTFGMILKILFLLILVFDLHFNSKCRYKKLLIVLLYMILLYGIIYVCLVLSQKGLDVFLYECQNVFRTFFLPVVLICFYGLAEENRVTIKWQHLSSVFVIYIVLLLIPIVTNTGFESYAYSKSGNVGWFQSANEIGGIFSILLPFYFLKITSFKLPIKIISLAIILYLSCSIGTKVPILSLAIVLFAFLSYQLIKWINMKKWKVIIFSICATLLSLVAFYYIVPKTSFYKNIMVHLEFLEIDSVYDLLTIPKIDHFIYSERVTFLENTLDNYNKSPIINKLFGIGYVENYGTDSVNLKMIEMDYYDIFFRHGWVGFICYFLPIFLILYKNGINKDTFFPQQISLILIFLLALFSGHILVAPSVSTFVGAVIVLRSELLT